MRAAHASCPEVIALDIQNSASLRTSRSKKSALQETRME
jgi:hypothetical protein